MKILILFVSALFLFPPLTIATPITKRQMTVSQATGAVNGDISLVNVSPAQALTISFIKTGQLIKKVWLGNPSKVVMDYDSPLCKDTAASGNCGASVIYLRQLAQPLNIEMNLPKSAKGNITYLTVITASGDSRYLYQFQLALNQPLVYSVLEILPDSAIPKLTPLLPSKPDSAMLNPKLLFPPKLSPLLAPKPDSAILNPSSLLQSKPDSAILKAL